MENLITPAEIIINDSKQFADLKSPISYFLNEVESNLEKDFTDDELTNIEDELIQVYNKMEVNLDEVKNIEDYCANVHRLANSIEDNVKELSTVIEKYQITKLSIYPNY